jgi:hypothetical protein
VGGMASRHPTFHCDETVAITAGAGGPSTRGSAFPAAG